MAISMVDQLMHTTVRLECELSDGRVSTGTGFFFSFNIEEKKYIPIIVTNKHVIKGCVKGTFVLTKRDDEGLPIIGEYQRVVIDNFENAWVNHPEEDVDLAAFPLARIFTEAEKNKTRFFTSFIEENLIPKQDKLEELSGLEDVTMIGYPNGIWDEKNNMPIVRRGITATNLKLDYNGLPIFLIDCSCFPGSSGSPVLLLDQNGYRDAKGSYHIGGTRMLLLGVLFAGPQHTAEGEIKVIDIPLQGIPISLSKIPNNLGFVVKSEKILAFKNLLL